MAYRSMMSPSHIAQLHTAQFHISEVAAAAGILPSELDLYGPQKAKVHLSVGRRLKDVEDGN